MPFGIKPPLSVDLEEDDCARRLAEVFDRFGADNALLPGTGTSILNNPLDVI